MPSASARSGVPPSGSGWADESGSCESREPGSAPRPGETLVLGAEATRYEIIQSLGTGGTAEVFLARRMGPAGFARPVALKCILAGLDVDEATRRSFIYEAALASKLRHPNIAEAYDLALVGDRYYLVLEYVDGITLRRALRASRAAGRPLSEAFCCHVVASVAEALHHAHTAIDEDGNPLGIVHRDVTAVNVMVARSGAVKLLDFGVALARLEGRERTRTGQFRGTFVYASPEQAVGEELDGRSDLFSLGVVFVEMLTGIRVFDAETDIGTMRKIAECSPGDVQAVTAALPRELAAICATALARRPADRFQDGSAFSHAIRAYLTARGTTYSATDCAMELQSLGVFASAPLSDRVTGSQHVSTRVARTRGAKAGPSEPGMARKSSRRSRHWVIVAVLACAILGAALQVMARARRPGLRVADSMPARALGPAGETEPHPALVQAPDRAVHTAADRELATDPEQIVRPRRARGSARMVAAAARVRDRQDQQPDAVASPHPDAAEAADRRESPPVPAALDHPPVRTSSAEFADRATVGSPRATLPRGTLVSVNLLHAIKGQNPGRADAIVTEEVAAGGLVVVQRGSTVSCSARAPAEGRVPLSCDTIAASDRVLRFTGVAVGEGHRVGLRILDDEIPAGTPFVVYVSAPAALR